MFVKATSLKGFNVDADDGPVGTIVDTCFDDESWVLSYLVVDTRALVGGRDVLVPVKGVREVDLPREKILLARSKDQVDHAPSQPDPDEAGPRARSIREVLGYHISASDGEFGHLEDVLIDPESWAIRYLLIDTKNWWPGPPVLVGSAWVNDVDWDNKVLEFDTLAERIKSCPPYDPTLPPTREYETQIHKHYSREDYWTPG